MRVIHVVFRAHLNSNRIHTSYICMIPSRNILHRYFQFSSLVTSLIIWLIIQDLLEDHQVQWDLPEDRLLVLQGVVMDLLPFLIRLHIHQCLRTECHQMRTSCQLLIHPLLQLPYRQVSKQVIWNFAPKYLRKNSWKQGWDELFSEGVLKFIFGWPCVFMTFVWNIHRFEDIWKN